MKISIIIPVYKENLINTFLSKLLDDMNFADYEIIIVDGDKSTTISTIINKDVIKISSKKGRANQMNEGAKIAKGEILLFLHADTLLPLNSLSKIEEALKNKNIQAGAFDLSFDSNKFLLKIISKVATFRSRITRLPYGDQGIFIKKDIFFKIGCYKSIELMEDINLMQKLKKENYKIFILKDKVITSARKWEESGVFYTTFRNWVLLGLYFLKINPNKLAKFYK